MTDACPACRSSRSTTAFAVRGHRFARCVACRSLFLTELPADEQTRELYSGARYFVNPNYGPPGRGEFLGYRDYLADRDHIERKFDEVLAHVELHRPDRGRLLDLGCGPGFLLSVAERRGWLARGLDLNDWAVRVARDELGMDATVGSLEDADVGEGTLDAVTMMDLIEHVADPDALIDRASRALRPGGVAVLLTPNAGSAPSRLMGARWPEAQRAPEHVVLYSVAGLAALLERHCLEPLGWHSVGKTSTLRTLMADVSPAAPAAASLAGRAVGGALAERTFELDPRTKFVLYARRRGDRAPEAAPPRIPRYPKRVPERTTDIAILNELELLADADRLCDWMYEQFAAFVGGTVVEVGAGIGTFTGRLLAGGAERLLAIEPEPHCAEALEGRYGSDPRLECAREELPAAPSLARMEGQADLVVCQNVLEHIDDHGGAVRAMAAALRPCGRLALLVPSHPRLYGSLDLAYGHWRRYTPAMVREVLAGAGLQAEDVYRFNALGIVGWWTKGRGGSTAIGPRALRAYEAMVAGWSALERRVRPPVGLTVVGIGRKPD